MDLLTLSASELRDRLLGRELSAVDLLDATLARIDAINPAVNAVVASDRASARRAAENADRRIADGQARPLEGLAITVKDSFDAIGLRSTAGASPFRDRVPDTDAAAVARLRTAGAVILGKSNVPAFTADFQTYNGLYGTTNNPWDVTRSPGGSSGGAAFRGGDRDERVRARLRPGELHPVAGACLWHLRPEDHLEPGIDVGAHPADAGQAHGP